MNAIEFVKKFGLDLVKRDVEAWQGGFIKREDFLEHYGFDILDDLKQIVDAFELVETGLPELKKVMFSNSKDLDYVKNWILTVSDKLLTEKGVRLKQAINLVEKCNA